MRSLTEATRLLLRHLQEAWRGGRSHSPDAETAGNLYEIGTAREPQAIPALLGFLFDRDEVAEAAARAVDQLVEDCDPLVLAELDGTVRRTTEWQWPVLRPTDVLPLSRGLTGTLGVLSFNASGYAREAALRALAEMRDGRELAFLLIRLNDWVEPVRDAAARAVGLRVRPDYAAHFVRCLPLVDRLQRQSRRDHGPIFDSVMALLRSEGSRTALRQATKSAERVTRRLAFRLLASAGGADQLEVLAEGLASSDTVMRLWAARESRVRLDGSSLRTALERIKRDSFMPVRREALYGFVERMPEAAPVELQAALLDPHPSIREAARFYLRQSGGEDFGTFYRGRLHTAHGDELRAAIAGLGETGAAQDAARLAAFFTHPDRRVRRAGVRAVGRLDPETYLEPLLTAMQDVSARVAREAAAAVRQHLHLVPPPRLWEIFQGNEPPVRRITLRLIERLQWWDGAPMLLAASDSEDEKTRELARTALDRASHNANVLSVRPRMEQLGLLEDALMRYGEPLDRPVRQNLASLLAYAKRLATG